MQSLLKKYFGYDTFRPLQEEIINNVVAGNDSFVLMPTGGGKSLCFQLPALKFQGLTLVISPLIALMKDQVDSLLKNGIEARFINSSLNIEEQDQITQELKNGQIKLLYIAPERLALPYFQEFLKSLNINLIAIDEAHCISEWGHDFRPDYRNLVILKKIFPQIPIIALTATATKKVQDDIIRQLSFEKAKIFVSSFNRENLNISVINKKNSFAKLVHILDNYKGKPTIIYTFSRKETEEITEKLKTLGFNALSYHAGLAPAERKKNQELFIRDSVNIIVATIAFGMGIDKPDIRLVIHYTFPKTLEGYYQEIGRAGRDGLASDCIMFYTYADVRKHEFFIGQIENTQLREASQFKLNEVLEFAESETCRKKILLKYFGEKLENDCQSCDVCLTENEKIDATIIVQKILSAIIRTENRFGKNHIIDCLLGKNTQQIRRNRHNDLSIFGIVNDFQKNELDQIIKSIINLGLVKKIDGVYPTLSITKKGAEFLSNKEKIELNKPKKDTIKEQQTPKTDLAYDYDLFEDLRKLRKELAEAENVPPFIIFGDKSLQEMAYYFPQSKEEFGVISGVGEKKNEKYSNAFLKIINEYLVRKNIDKNEVKQKYIEKMANKNRLNLINKNVSSKKYYQKTLELLQKKTSLENIAKHQDKALDTIINHLEKIIDDEIKVDFSYLMLPRERFLNIKNAFNNFEDERLKPVYEYLGGRYSYDEIKLIRVLMKIEE